MNFIEKYFSLRNFLIISVCAVLLISFSSYFGVSAGNLSKINSIEAHNPELSAISVDIKYQGDRPKIKNFVLKIKNSNTERFVIDLLNSDLKTSQIKNKSFFNSIGIDFTSGQFDKTTTRLVFKTQTKIISNLKIEQNKNGLIKILVFLNKNNSDQTEIINQRFPDKSNTSTNINNTNNFIPKTNKTDYISIEALSNSSAKIIINAKSLSKIDYKIFELKNPDRLVLDLKNWEASPSKMSQIKSSSGLITKIRAGLPEKNKKTVRLVFDLGAEKITHRESLSNNKTLLINLISANPVINSNNSTTEEIANINNSTNTEKTEKKLRKNLVVMLDAGHGGYDSGAIHSGIEEKNLDLAISKKIKNLLEEKDIKVIMTRNSDVFLSLEERVEKTVKNKPDIFISIHCNALDSNTNINGAETYYYTTQSKDLALTIHDAYVKTAGVHDRKVRKARFVVIRETLIPSILMETGFMTNKNELKLLQTDKYQDKMAEGIVKGIVNYFTE